VNHDQVLTIKEIAEILKLADKTVYSMAQDGELPVFKVRGQWRIRRVDFEGWMIKQAKKASGPKR
jgi:excisionase family DNA binding protein